MNTAECPNCGIRIHLVELNCLIIRCGASVKESWKLVQFPPHASLKEIQALLAQPHVGCGVPLEFDPATKTFETTTYDA